MKVITVNRKAYHDYHILESLEAGLALTGTEIKSIRAGRVNIRDAYARGEGGELWLYGAHIAQYPAGGRYNHDPIRPRKLLLRKREISYLIGQSEQKGLTLIPLKLYIKSHVAKVELALAKGQAKYDKREAIARREAERQMAKAVRRRPS